jgi:hypothetical protein
MNHLPHRGQIPHVPHVHLRSVGHDALVAAELALAAVVLTGSIEGGSFSRAVDATSASLTANTPTAARVADMASSDLVPSVSLSVVGTGTVAHVYVPSSGSNRIELTDSANVTESTLVIGQPTTRIPSLAAGEYHIVVTTEGPVEVVGEAAISSAMSVRSPVIVIGAGDVLTITQVAAS